MSIPKVVHKWERVVPVRFARAPHDTDPTINSGPYHQHAPEPDDRGFLPHSIGGPIFPISLDTEIDVALRPEFRVRLIRMDMDNAGQLFLSVENPAIIELTQPVPNDPLPNQKFMMIKMKALAGGSTNLRVHFGSVGGPIIHQMQVLVSRFIDVPVLAHVPTINGAAFVNPSPPPPGAPFPTAQGTAFPAQSGRTNASIQSVIDNTNIIYFPYGIRFVLDPAVDRAGVLNFQNQGMMDPGNNEFDLGTALNRRPHAVNAYFVPQIANPVAAGAANTPINQVAGIASSAISNPTTYGLYVADWTNSFQVTAHEIGHLLHIVNDPTNEFVHINTREDARFGGTGRPVRFDTISRRRLMWSFTNFFSPNPARPRGVHDAAYRDDVGYGNNTVGGMLTIKQYDNDKSDLELAEVRKTAGILP